MTLDVHGTQVRADHPCPHLSPDGCGSYQSRPAVCKDFICAWLHSDLNLPDWMKPDNSKAILRRLKNARAIVAVPVGRKIPPRAFNFLKALCNKERFALLHFERVKQNGRYTIEIKAQGYAPPGCEQEFRQIQDIVKQISM